ncbi:hypothetical protein LJC33_00570 [Eubacteriales bacterium OttesenSCG-928-N13]|nr:hypothetical protein [Eubacteriales bacterium OttesenSCG-928-N13]
MAKKDELAVIDTQNLQVVPAADDLATIMGELQDMGTLPYGRIQIGAAGAGIFQVTEPGEDEPVVATEVTAVVILNHRTNVLWLSKFGTVEDRTPDCMSFDGEEGIDRETGEIRKCEQCAYNKFGSADGGTSRGKACKNTRRLYLMRPSDVFPSMLTLPSTALSTFDKYRTKVMLSKNKLHGVVTKITLKKASNKDGIAYSTPIFEIVGVLPADEAQRVKQYADAFQSAMSHSAVYEEPSGSVAAPTYTPPAAVTDDDADELPFD